MQQVVGRLRRSKLFWSAVVLLLLAVAALKVALHFWLIPASYADARLKTDAKKVPAPAGLVFTGYSHQSYDGFPVTQQEADMSYDNPSMSCDQLTPHGLRSWRNTTLRSIPTTAPPWRFSFPASALTSRSRLGTSAIARGRTWGPRTTRARTSNLLSDAIAVRYMTRASLRQDRMLELGSRRD